MWKQKVSKKNVDVAILVSQKYKKKIHADDMVLKKSLEDSGYVVEIVAWDNKKIDFSRFRIAIVRSCWDYDKRVFEFLMRMESISSQCRLINSLDIIEGNSNKYYLKNLESSGVRIVPVEFANTIEQVKIALKKLREKKTILKKTLHTVEECEVRGVLVKQQTDAHEITDLDSLLLDDNSKETLVGSTQVVIKPVSSASGRDTYRIDIDNEIAILKRSQDILKKKDVMIQPYINTIETLGEKSTVVIDGLPVYTMLKKPKDGSFLVHEHHGGTYTETRINSLEKAFVQKIISTFAEKPVYMRVDYLFDQIGEPMLLELELIEPNLYLSKSELVLEKLTQRLIEILGESKSG